MQLWKCSSDAGARALVVCLCDWRYYQMHLSFWYFVFNFLSLFPKLCVCAHFFAFAFVVKVEWNYPTAKKNALGRCLSNNCLCDGIWCCFSLYDMDIYRIHTMHMLERIHFGFGLISVRAFVCSNPCAPPHSVNYNSTCDFIIINASLSALSRFFLFACWFASLQRAQFFFHIFSSCEIVFRLFSLFLTRPIPFSIIWNPYISTYMNKRHLETISGPSDNFCCDYFPRAFFPSLSRSCCAFCTTYTEIDV